MRAARVRPPASLYPALDGGRHAIAPARRASPDSAASPATAFRLGQTGDVARVARFLTGSAVGLALGGGFARGLAHLGALRALHELGIPIDAIGGASMGALVGAQWALGWDASRIVHETCTGLADSFDDMTIPFLSFKRGGKFSRLVRRFFADTQIEDLWLPDFCVSANLNRAELQIHTTGSLSQAVLASTRAPGVFPPVVMDGELHVDGGLINNVPVAVMKTFSNQGMVIALATRMPNEPSFVSPKTTGPPAAAHVVTPSIARQS